MIRAVFVLSFVLLGAAISAQTQPPQTRPPARPPARPATQRPAQAQGESGEAIARRVCGVTCHPFENVITIRRTRQQWEATVENMIGRGARGTSTEFAAIIDFLSSNFILAPNTIRGGSGPDDRPMVDPKAAEIARPLYMADCSPCHGPDARGTSDGANLVRSEIVLRDRYGSAIGPFLRTAHPPVPGVSKPAALTDTQILLLSHFIRERLTDTLRGSPMFKAGDVLTGDAKAGADYFNGEGGCTKCHSPTGDLAAIGRRMDPITIQQRFLFPSNAGSRRRSTPAPAVTVTVTTPAGESLSGTLVHMDDFHVSLRDEAGGYRTVRRGLDVRIVKNDPYAAHVELLSRITDKAIHDVVAYLESLK